MLKIYVSLSLILLSIDQFPLLPFGRKERPSSRDKTIGQFHLLLMIWHHERAESSFGDAGLRWGTTA